MKVSKFNETDNNIIYINEGEIKKETQALEALRNFMQLKADQWHEITGTELKTDDLQIIINGGPHDHKELLFSKLAGKGERDNLFGIKINKSKALDMLEMPDVSSISKGKDKAILQAREHLNTNRNRNFPVIDVSMLEIAKGTVTIKKSAVDEIRKKHTVTADTDEQKARLAGFLSITKTIKSLINSGAIKPPFREYYLSRVIRFSDSGEISVNHEYIKKGNGEGFDEAIKV